MGWTWPSPEPLTPESLQAAIDQWQRSASEPPRPHVRYTGPGEVEYEACMRREESERDRLRAEEYRKAVSRPKAPALRSTMGRR